MFKKNPDFSKESEAAPAKPVRCQETARMVESPAGIAALPAVIPCESTGTKLPLAQLLLKHSLININPVSLQNSHYIFHSLCAKHTAMPRIIHHNTERRSVTLGPRRQVCSEVNKTLAPLQMTVCLFSAPSKALVLLGSGLASLRRCGDPRHSSWYVRRAKLQSPSLNFGAKPAVSVPRSWMRCLLSKAG